MEDNTRQSKSGVALVIVLGILLLLSLAVLSFVRVTSDSRDTSRLAAERMKAEHLARTALVRAMEDVNTRMAGNLFYWQLDDGASDNFIVSTNGTAGLACNLLTSMVAIAEVPGVLNNEAIQVATHCRWMPMLAGTVTVGRCAYLIANLSGFIDANAVGGMPSSNRVSASELDLSPLFSAAPDVEAFLSDRTNHIRYETREELFRLNTGITNHVEDVFTVFSYDPNPDVYFASTNGIGTQLFRTNLASRFCVTNIFHPDFRSNLTAVLSSSVTNASFIADCIIDYQDPDRYLQTNGAITESIPLLWQVNITNNAALNNVTVDLVYWYPFYPPPETNESFQVVVTASTDRETTAFTTTLTSFDFTAFTTNSFSLTITPGSNLNVTAVMQWRHSTYTTNAWSTEYTFRLQNSETVFLSIDDPRLGPDTNRWTNIVTSATISTGLPVYVPNRPMKNIGELGYVWTGEPWRTLDLTQTNIATLLDRLTVRSTPTARRGLLSVSSTNALAWETMFSRIPFGITNVPGSSYAGTTTVATATAFADYMARRSDFSRTFSDLLPFIGASPCYTNPFPEIPNVSADLKEDVLRGIVELVSFRHQLYLVMLAVQPLAADGLTPTAERRAMALVWRDGYTGQYFVRNFRWIVE